MTTEEEPKIRHPGGPNGVKDRQQYVALLEAVGNWTIARKLMDEMIKWASAPTPSETPYILDRWEHEWTEGRLSVTDTELKRMRQRLMANEEWANRRLIAKCRKVAHAVGDKVMKRIDNNEQLQGSEAVAMRYATEPVNVLTLSTNNAYGTPKPTATQIGKLVINAGERPQRKLKAPKIKVEDVIEGEVRELPIGRAD